MSSIKELNQRLSMVEASTPGLTEFEQVKKKKTEDVLKKVDQVAEQQAKIRKVNLNRFIDVVSFVVDFVEILAEYVPDIVSVVGGAFVGEFKLVTAVRLITKLCTDVASSVITPNLLEDVINHEVDLKFHQHHLPDGTTVTEGKKVTKEKIEKKKLSKRGCFPSPFATKGSKKET